MTTTDAQLLAELRKKQGTKVPDAHYIVSFCGVCALIQWCAKYVGPQCLNAIKRRQSKQ